MVLLFLFIVEMSYVIVKTIDTYKLCMINKNEFQDLDSLFRFHDYFFARRIKLW